MSYTVLAWWKAEPGDEDEIARLLEELTGPTRQESGCLVFRVHRNPDDPTDFFLYELYREEADYLAHHASDHFRRLASEQAIPRLADRRRQIYSAVDELDMDAL